MKLVNLTVNDYLEVLKSDAPAPGGGSVSALAGAQGVGLFMMVADLTIGKEKYADCQDICKAAKKEGAFLYEELVIGIDKDTEAFNMVSTAFKMAKDTDVAKAERSKAIAAATMVATEVPFKTMKLCYRGLELAETLTGHSNSNAASDLGVSVLNLSAGIKGAWLNVMINLPGIKDEEKKSTFEKEGTEIITKSEELASKLYRQIFETL